MKGHCREYVSGHRRSSKVGDRRRRCRCGWTWRVLRSGVQRGSVSGGTHKPNCSKNVRRGGGWEGGLFGPRDEQPLLFYPRKGGSCRTHKLSQNVTTKINRNTARCPLSHSPDKCCPRSAFRFPVQSQPLFLYFTRFQTSSPFQPALYFVLTLHSRGTSKANFGLGPRTLA